MDKVFEALEEIGNIDLGDNPYKKFEDNKLKNVYNKEFAILYNALTELKQIKEAEPSKAMERVNYLSAILPDWQKVNNGIDTLITIKNYILKAQELEKENAELKKKIDSYERNIEIYASKQLEIDNFYLRNENIEYNEVSKIINQHLLFEYNGTAIVKDFITDKEEIKNIIKVRSKDTDATINILLDAKGEVEILKRWTEKWELEM